MNRKKIIIGLVILLLLVGVGVGFFVYKNINEKPAQIVQQEDNIAPVPIKDPSTDPKSPATSQSKVMLSGVFEDGDAVHSGSGTAQITVTNNKPVLSFSDDFSVTSGPDLFVYLSPNSADQSLGKFTSLGKLKSNSGAQAYNLPDDYQNYKTVVIWCRAFGVNFANAELTDQ